MLVSFCAPRGGSRDRGAPLTEQAWYTRITITLSVICVFGFVYLYSCVCIMADLLQSPADTLYLHYTLLWLTNALSIIHDQVCAKIKQLTAISHRDASYDLQIAGPGPCTFVVGLIVGNESLHKSSWYVQPTKKGQGIALNKAHIFSLSRSNRVS